MTAGLDIATICDGIRSGQTLTDTAAAAGVSRPTLHTWLHADPARLALADRARHDSADALVDCAQAVLMALPSSATPAQVVQARELAHHYRWKASKIRPDRFGDKVTADVKVTIDPLAELIAQVQQRGSRLPLRGLGDSADE